MFCYAEFAPSSIFVLFSLVCLCCSLFAAQISIVSFPQLKHLIVPSCLLILPCYIFYLSSDLVVLLVSAVALTSSLCFRAHNQSKCLAQLTSIPGGVLALSLALTQISTHSFMIFIAFELLSLSTLMLIAECTRGTNNAKFNILTYYWVGAICSMGLSLLVVFYNLQLLSSHYINSRVTLGGTISTLAVLLLISTKLGALPSGFWAIWFYESIGAGALVTYISSFYPTLLFVVFLLLSFFYTSLPFCSSAMAFFVLMVLISTVITLFSGRASGKRVAPLLVSLTSVTFLLMVGSLAALS